MKHGCFLSLLAHQRCFITSWYVGIVQVLSDATQSIVYHFLILYIEFFSMISFQ